MTNSCIGWHAFFGLVFQWRGRKEIILIDNTAASLLLHYWLNLSSFFCDFFVLLLEKWKSLIIFKQGPAMYWCYKKWAEKSLLLAWCWCPLAPPTMSVENTFFMWRNFRFLFMTDLDLVDHVFLQVNCTAVCMFKFWFYGDLFPHWLQFFHTMLKIRERIYSDVQRSNQFKC